MSLVLIQSTWYFDNLRDIIALKADYFEDIKLVIERTIRAS